MITYKTLINQDVNPILDKLIASPLDLGFAEIWATLPHNQKRSMLKSESLELQVSRVILRESLFHMRISNSVNKKHSSIHLLLQITQFQNDMDHSIHRIHTATERILEQFVLLNE